MAEVNRREQVKELIASGTYTKAEIAEKLSVNASSVSSQMTYLRWMGNFILADADKKLRFCTEDEWNAAQEVVIANRKAKSNTASKTPQEQANALAKTLVGQKKMYEKAVAKCTQIDADLALEPSDIELQELKAEADANATLLRIKIARNEKRATELPAPEAVVAAEVVDEADADETTDGDEDLL